MALVCMKRKDFRPPSSGRLAGIAVLAMCGASCHTDTTSDSGSDHAGAMGNGAAATAGTSPTGSGGAAGAAGVAGGAPPSFGGSIGTAGTDHGGSSTGGGTNGGAPAGGASGGESALGPGGSDAGGSVAGGAGGLQGMTLERAQREYLGWHRFTEEPEAISIQIASLCRLPTAAENAFVDSVHGHRLFLLDWLNDAAKEGFANKDTAPFPVGATIVKEKLKRPLEGGELTLLALGVLLKREPGFDPEHGDWEFGYWEAESGMLAGAEESAYCGGCHAGSTTDFVFLDHSWRQSP